MQYKCNNVNRNHYREKYMHIYIAFEWERNELARKKMIAIYENNCKDFSGFSDFQGYTNISPDLLAE